ncbi:ATP-binding protein [Georgenia wangjunii]|uniref:ATP-binding protein n=1 Tax=Georgenia wangjunii TaxID=3117730 RepID=UPI002F265D9A
MSATPMPAPPRLPLRRPDRGRRVAGVCRGVAAHLDLPVERVRLAFALATLAFGAGAMMYVWLWLFVPPGDPAAAAAEARPAAGARLAPRLRTMSRAVSLGDVVLALLLILAAVLLVLWRAGITLPSPWLVPALVAVGGAGLVWSQLDSSLPGAAASRPRRAASVLRVVGGLLLALVGTLLLLGRGEGLAELLGGTVAGAAILGGAALVLAPLWLRLVRDLGAERAARAREAERADIAAHLHDSVLQTLSLIRSRAGDADQVARLARAQERQLREWLYADRPAAGTSVAAAVRQVAAEVEDLHGVAVDVVTAGDREPDDATAPLLAATREALTNAAVHGAPPVSLYVEVGEGATEVFVRDRGAGFDLAAVPADRHGVRESIIERLERHGGTARIRSGGGTGLVGTEVRLSMPAAGARA